MTNDTETMFTPSLEATALADAADRMVREHYAEIGPDRKQAPRAPDARRWQEFADLGWLGITLEESAGGLGLPLSTPCVLAEHLAAAVMPEPLLSNIALAEILLPALPASSPQEQLMAQWLSGQTRLALAHHEDVNAACFATRPKARIKINGDSLHLNGSKRAVLDGGAADQLLISAVNSDDSNELLLLVLPLAAGTQTAGLTVTESAAADGRVMADVVMDKLILPSTTPLLRALPLEAINFSTSYLALLLSAETLGVMRCLVTITHTYLEQREQFGSKLADFQALQHRLVDMQMSVVRLESMLVRVTALLDQFGLAAVTDEISALKVLADNCGRQLGAEAMQLHGAIGITAELNVGYYVKRMLGNAFAAGQSREHLQRLAAD